MCARKEDILLPPKQHFLSKLMNQLPIIYSITSVGLMVFKQRKRSKCQQLQSTIRRKKEPMNNVREKRLQDEHNIFQN